MNIDMRIDPKLGGPLLRKHLREHAHSVLDRLSPRLQRLELHVRRHGSGGAGGAIARVTGIVEGIGPVHVRATGDHHGKAVSSALARFRRAAFESLERRRPGRSRVA